MSHITGNKEEKPTLTSLCPTLGKRDSVIISGMCPESLQNPNGKEMPVSIIGAYPYMIYNKENGIIGGADIDIIELYARKFDFIPKIMKAPSADGAGGKVDMESIIHKSEFISEFSLNNWVIGKNCDMDKSLIKSGGPDKLLVVNVGISIFVQ